MNTNQFFSLSRLWLLLRNDMMMNYKKYLLNIGGALVVCFIILYMFMPTRPGQGIFTAERYQQAFMILLIGLGGFTGMAFPFLGEKRQLSTYLLTPASTFEKYLSQFIIRVVAGTFVFFFIFYIDTFFARSVVMSMRSSNTIDVFSFSDLYRHINKTGEQITITMVLVSIGIYLFSIKTFFQKAGLVKSVITFGLLFFSVILLFIFMSHLFYPETKGFDVKLTMYKAYHGYYNMEIWLAIIANLSVLFLLPLGYFKLKEKQL